MLLFLFWASIAIIGYTFAGYPLTLALWGAVRPRSWRREPYEPAVSVVIAAHNEAGFISQKIRNLIALDYPADRLEILIGSDGSTDGTAERILAISEARVRPFIFPQRRGKAEVLNTLIPKARGEIILLADARQTFDPSVLRVLTRSFADPEVGAVSGELVLGRSQPGSAVGNGSGLYWRYEKFIRSRESAVDSSIGATGAIYAIRKSLFQSIPDDTILDDVLIPLRITRGGHRVVFDREALAYDFASAAPGQEFTRKVRTLAGNFQLFARERWLCNPFRNRLWWQVISHKALRLIVAPLQVTVAASNIALILVSVSPLYKLAMLAQILFYAGALASFVLPSGWKKPFVITFPFIFCLMSWATVLAFVRSITGRQAVTWQKAPATGTST